MKVRLWTLLFFVGPLSEAQLPPQFTEEPAGYKYLYKNSKKEQFDPITCKANGTHPIKYLWYFAKKSDKEKIPQWKTDYILVQTDKNRKVNKKKLMFPKWKKRLAGFYRCTAENDYGTAVSSAIHILHAGSFPFEVVKLKKFNVTDGEPVTIPCRGRPSSTPEPIYSWTNSSTSLNLDPNIVTDQNGNLHILARQTSYSSNDTVYLCYSRNTILRSTPKGSRTKILNSPKTGKSTKKSLRIAFTSRMKLNADNASTGNPTYVRYNSTLRLQCIAHGDSLPKIQWTHNERDINTNDKRVHFTHISFYNLEIKEVRESDGGHYICYVEGHANIRESMDVVVQMPPILIVKPETAYLVVGSNKTFMCKGRNPKGIKDKIKTAWFANGTVVDRSMTYNGLNCQPDIFLIWNANKAHTMSAMCILSNNIGETSVGFRVYVVDELIIKKERVSGQLGNRTVEYDENNRAPHQALTAQLPVALILQIKVTVEKLVENDLRIAWILNESEIDAKNHSHTFSLNSNDPFVFIIDAKTTADLTKIFGKYSVKLFIPYVEGYSSTLRMLNLQAEVKDQTRDQIIWIPGPQTNITYVKTSELTLYDKFWYIPVMIILLFLLLLALILLLYSNSIKEKRDKHIKDTKVLSNGQELQPVENSKLHVFNESHGSVSKAESLPLTEDMPDLTKTLPLTTVISDSAESSLLTEDMPNLTETPSLREDTPDLSKESGIRDFRKKGGFAVHVYRPFPGCLRTDIYTSDKFSQK